MSTKYKKIRVVDLKGLKEAERLKSQGWIIYSIGLFSIHFYKKFD